jgi:hypothetical protein
LNAQKLLFTENEFRNCYIGVQGGVIHAENTAVYDTKNLFQSNAGINGGVVYCAICIPYMSYQSKYFDNYGQEGGVIFANTRSKVQIEGSEFRGNGAMVRGGVANLSNGAKLYILDSSFKYNWSLDDTSVVFMIGCDYSLIVGSDFSHNSA